MCLEAIICHYARNVLAFMRHNHHEMAYMTELDSQNLNILRVLEHDGRISNVELARKVGLSPSACLRRVQDMERSGVIAGYRAILDRGKLGSAITIFVMVGLSEHLRKDALAFEAAVTTAPQVRECHNITGNVEYLLRVEVDSLETYKSFHANVLGTLPQVHSITSYISLGSPKDERA